MATTKKLIIIITIRQRPELTPHNLVHALDAARVKVAGEGVAGGPGVRARPVPVAVGEPALVLGPIGPKEDSAALLDVGLEVAPVHVLQLKGRRGE